MTAIIQTRNIQKSTPVDQAAKSRAAFLLICAVSASPVRLLCFQLSQHLIQCVNNFLLMPVQHYISLVCLAPVKPDCIQGAWTSISPTSSLNFGDWNLEIAKYTACHSGVD